MLELYRKLLSGIDKKRLRENITELWRRELPQTFNAYMNAAEFTLELLREAGIDNAEIINFPADGRSVYQDKRMPLAWDASMGRLRIISSPLGFPDPVIADYERHPFHLVRGSVSTPPGGLKVGIITEEMMLSGVSAFNCLVLAASGGMPRPEALKMTLDQGGRGILTDFMRGSGIRNETPDAVYWANWVTEGLNWHVECDDREFIAYSISPRDGDRLRAALKLGKVEAVAENDGRRYTGVLPAVSAVIPGRRSEELWLLAHLFEPLIDDNSTGVVGAVEMARVIKGLIAGGDVPRLEFSLRLVFASELYGFAAYATSVGTNLRERCIGAVNLDSMPSGNPGERFQPQFSPAATPFFGNSILEILSGEYRGNPPIDRIRYEGGYSDDTFMSDPDIGLPTAWIRSYGKKFWHHSALNEKMLDIEILASLLAFAGTWVVKVATLSSGELPPLLERAAAYAVKHLDDEAEALRLAMNEDKIRSSYPLREEIRERMQWRLRIESERLGDFGRIAKTPELEVLQEGLSVHADRLIAGLQRDATGKNIECGMDEACALAESLVFARTGGGFYHDLAGVPAEKRRKLPDMLRIIANMDGRKTLMRAIREAEWEEGCKYNKQQVADICSAAFYLAEYAYLKRQNLTE